MSPLHALVFETQTQLDSASPAQWKARLHWPSRSTTWARGDNLGPWLGALQWRYFGARPLLEDNSVRSSSTALFKGRIGYKVNAQNSVELEGFNLGNKRASAIDYYYASRLPGEASGGTDDVHCHPTESRSFRLTWIHHF
jgi:TonB dependent receptor